MLHRIYAIMVKEVRQVRRDTRTLAQLIFVPALMLTLYGYALTFDVKHIAIVVLDYDKSATSRNFIDGFLGSEYFDLVGTISREEDANWWLDSGRARAVIIIPWDFTRKLDRHEEVPIQVLVDGSNANSANITLGYVEAKVREYTLDRVRRMADAAGVSLPSQPVQLEPRIWYNPTLESSQFLVPGLIAYLLMLVGTVSTSLSVVREKERGTLEQIIVSSTQPFEFIIGKAVPYLVISLLTEALIIVAAMVLFGMPLRGSVAWLFVASFIYLLGALGLGLFISSIATTQQVAFQIAGLITLLPSFILSDMVFPITSMPRALQWVSEVIPPRHFVAISRGVVLKGTGPGAWGVSLGVLVVFAAIMLTIAARRLHASMRRS